MRPDPDGIDWASLTHAYGSAEDVPGLLRDLRSADDEVRAAALYELYGTVYHQGTRYEASAYAVPFLLDLLADPATPARHELVQLLSCLAVGHPPSALPVGGFRVAETRNRVAQVTEQTWRRWSQALTDWHEAVSAGRREPFPLTVPERRLVETRHALATYDAVRAGVPLLVSCLADGDPEVVGEAIHALAWFPEELTAIRPHLLDIAADDERPVRTVETALVALGLLGGAVTPPVAELLDRNLAGSDPHLSWAAAMAWAQLAGDETPAPVIAEQPTSNWHNHFNVVLGRAFPRMEADHGRAFAELTAAQQAVVGWLVDHPQVFGSSGPQGPLRQHGLPTTHDGLRAYAGR
ncbi:HEAT repeat domain-containing protein [Micromonospora auratinigra]|uniref:HEAT repeat-containing protein n=1 Tax=Micromonospora auratinigra TaxID=261654 RepID=A0A1A8ZI71_9ACTN|nr:HEAT repeat domain-containing protein [Micromonospora auratinigra]SBT43572.1 HEAT repeat-containing protein [Micromonospora auratinigra]